MEEEYEDEEDSLLIDEDEGSDDEDGEMGDLRLSAASTQPMQVRLHCVCTATGN